MTQNLRYDQLQDERLHLKARYEHLLFVVENLSISLWDKKHNRAHHTWNDPYSLILDHIIATEERNWDEWDAALEETHAAMDLRYREILLLHSVLQKMLKKLEALRREFGLACYRIGWTEVEYEGIGQAMDETCRYMI
jgi:hypothetical protein